MSKNSPKIAILVSIALALLASVFGTPAAALARPGVSGGGTGFAGQSASAHATLAATTTSTAPLPEFGTQFHGMWSSYTDAQRAMVLDTLKANGATTVRLDVSWAMLNPSSASWSTWGTDFVTRVLKMITDRGMKPMVMVWLTPKWVTGSSDDRVAPQTTTQLARWQTFNKQLAAKFPQVTDWEIWNEPNHNDFMRGASASVYAKVLASGYRGIKAGNPNARVIFAGTQYIDTPWITKALAAGAKGKYDIMGVHPYMAVANLSPDSPDTDGIWRLRHIPSLRKAMLAVGDDKPIWFTEFGWRVGSLGTANWQLGVDEATQAKYLADTLRIVRNEYPYVTRVYWYRELADNNTSTSSGYGLIQPDGTVKPALKQIPAIYAAG
jgi:polysaccharide biosynthesis protein PslG